jgi:phospholipase C
MNCNRTWASLLTALVILGGCTTDDTSASDDGSQPEAWIAPLEVPESTVDPDAEIAADDVGDATDDATDDADLDPAAALEADELDDAAMEDADPADVDAPGDEVEDEDIDDEPALTTDVSRLSAAVQASIPTKIKYVLVIVKENHTFDNYFTGFPGATSSKYAYKWNGDKRVKFLRPFAPDGRLPSSPSHTHHKAVMAYRHGHMDGFSTNPGPVPYMRYKQDQIPAYWKYASEYVLADHVFSESLAPSSPGHEVFWFGRSTTIDNPTCHLPGGTGCGHGCTGTHLTATAFNPRTGKERTVKPCFDLPSLPDHLPHGFTWIDYGGQMAKQIKSQQHVSASHYGSTKQLLKDLKNGTVHNLMIAHISGGAFSEHPPEGPCQGERFTTEVINAAMQLPEYKHMAIVVTWDDWGGFYDHVRPPVHRSENGAIYGRGFRLPLLIISPYAKKGFVLKTPAEQASVPRLVEELWGMKFMTTRNSHARDGRAGSLLGAFDFSQTPRAPKLLATRSCPGDP